MAERAVRIAQRSARRTTLRTARRPPVSADTVGVHVDGASTGSAPTPTAARMRTDGRGRGTGDPGVPSSDLITSLRMLAQLRDEGVLSSHEFVAAKARIMGI